MEQAAVTRFITSAESPNLKVAVNRENGVTAGVSAPEILVRRVVDRIKELTGAEVGQLVGVEEGDLFPLPKGLA
jgi:4-hydroxy-3-methylbut-2-en-1-yl diphosphate reductase